MARLIARYLPPNRSVPFLLQETSDWRRALWVNSASRFQPPLVTSNVDLRYVIGQIVFCNVALYICLCFGINVDRWCVCVSQNDCLLSYTSFRLSTEVFYLHCWGLGEGERWANALSWFSVLCSSMISKRIRGITLLASLRFQNMFRHKYVFLYILYVTQIVNIVCLCLMHDSYC
jgi:hypothetical protein